MTLAVGAHTGAVALEFNAGPSQVKCYIVYMLTSTAGAQAAGVVDLKSGPSQVKSYLVYMPSSTAGAHTA